MGIDDAILLKTNYTFDVSVTELFGWFIGKSKLVILKPGLEKEPEALINIIEKKIKLLILILYPLCYKYC